jgi:predicted RNA binding protein YcfA (HicA-like mRNA interferase family)
MARLPVLKPREVAHVLEKMGFVEVRQRGSHKNIVTRMDDARPFRFTEAVMFRLFC